MPRWHGPASRGAMRELRKLKRIEAEQRNRLTPFKRRRAYRRNRANND